MSDQPGDSLDTPPAQGWFRWWMTPIIIVVLGGVGFTLALYLMGDSVISGGYTAF